MISLPTLWKKSEIVPKETISDGEIVVVNSTAMTKPSGGQMVKVRKKAIKVFGESIDLDPQQLMRMIKQATRTIGEYKGMNNPMSLYVTPGIRKSRDQMVSDLAHHFHINWELDNNGTSIFSM